MYGGTRWCVWHKTQIGWFIISPQKSHSDNANFTWILKQKDLLRRRTFSSTKHSCNESAFISWQTTSPHNFAISLIISHGSQKISQSPQIHPFLTPSYHGRSQLLDQGPGLGHRHHRWLVQKVTGHPPRWLQCKQLIEPPPLLWSFPGRFFYTQKKTGCGWNINLCHGFLWGSFTKKIENTAKRIAVGEDRISLLIGAQLLFLVSGTNLFCGTSMVSSLSPESLQHGQKRITVMHEPRQCWTVETPPFSKTLKNLEQNFKESGQIIIFHPT